jgi:hypothetical protein
MKNKNLKKFFGFSVLMFVAFLSFTSVANAQYVSPTQAIQRLKLETTTNGNFKQQGSTPSAKIPTTVLPIDYAKTLRLTYVNELLNLVVLYGNVGTAIDVNNANWTQRTTGQPARMSSLPVLKAYVIDLLKA